MRSHQWELERGDNGKLLASSQGGMASVPIVAEQGGGEGRVPTHMGCLFVPNAIGDSMEQHGNELPLTVRLRTNDNNSGSHCQFEDHRTILFHGNTVG